VCSENSKLEVAGNLVAVCARLDRNVDRDWVLGYITQVHELLKHTGRNSGCCPLDDFSIHARYLGLDIRVRVGNEIGIHDAHEGLKSRIVLTANLIARLGLDDVNYRRVKTFTVKFRKEGVPKGGWRTQADRLDVIRSERTHYSYSS
jgi:hypothetical protein